MGGDASVADEDGALRGPTDGAIGQSCGDIAQILASLEDGCPSWEVIDCFAKQITRLDLPSYGKRILAVSDYFGQVPGQAPMHAAVWDDIWNTGIPNISPALSTAAPVHKLTWPNHSLSQHEELLRCMALVFLDQKLKGRPVFFIDFYPPNEATSQLKTKDDLLQWWNTTYIDRAKLEAETAERIKAEYYGPLFIELEVFIGSQPAVNDLPDAEQVQLAQQLLDTVFSAVRPLYSGRLVVHSYRNYTGPTDPFVGLYFKDWDEVHFSLFPMCDLAYSKEVYDKQLGIYVEIAQRDEIAWGIGEFESFKHNFNCDGQGNIHDQIQDQLYGEFFQRITSITPAPVNIGVGHWPAGQQTDTWTAATKKLVLEEMAKLP